MRQYLKAVYNAVWVLLTVGLGFTLAHGFYYGVDRLASVIVSESYSSPQFVYKSNDLKGASARIISGGYTLLQNSKFPRVSAKSFLVADLDDGFIFAERNSKSQRPIASLTKLMTAVVSLETVNQLGNVFISKEIVGVPGEGGGFVAGEKFKAGQLLYPLLLPSSNDAAYAIAKTVGVEKFVDLMNRKADSLGLEHTRFTDPAGLDGGNVSSAEELLLLLKYIRDVHEPIFNITRTRRYTASSGTLEHVWNNYNWRGEMDEFIGGKIGYTDEAGNTMAALFRVEFSEFGKRDIGIVVLGSSDQERDVRNILEWVKNNYIYGDAVNDKISFVFVGDIMLDRGILRVIEGAGEGDFGFPFREITGYIADADITFGNLEGPISDRGKNVGSMYSFRMKPGAAKALFDAGFDIVSLANNHAGDWGIKALEDTFRRLYNASIAFTGAGWNKDEAYSVRIIRRFGRKVGFLAFSDVGPKWMEAGDAVSGIAIAREQLLTEAVRQAAGLVDILVVSLHFGEEYKTGSNAHQRRLARAAVDAGADVIVGHHPHVVQELERYNGGLIAYSLGNFVFDQAFSVDTRKSIILRVEFNGGKISNISTMPITFNSYYQPIVQQEF